MDYLHAWGGVLFAALLLSIFLMGTLSVFDRELDRWAQPASRAAAAPAPAGATLDAAAASLRALAPADAGLWLLYPPGPREPVPRVGWRAPGGNGQRDLDPATAAPLPVQGGAVGTGFAFPFHFSLHLKWRDLGYWLVGAAGMATLVAIASGVVVHRRIFKDVFTFRPAKPTQRAALDLHNATAVLALPFHFVIALSGLVIFFGIYMRAGIDVAYRGDRAAFAREAQSTHVRPPIGVPLAQPASLDAIVAEARARWAARGAPGEAMVLILRHPTDAAGVASVRRAYRDRVSLTADTVHFDLATGAVLHEEVLPPGTRVQRFVSGLHFIQFEHWTLRWLYFVLGLAGCAMIASGLVVWCEKRRRRHAAEGRSGALLVEALAVAATVGLPVAFLAMLVANRLLPAGLADPLAWEMRIFFAVWAATLVHAWALRRRGRAHWRQQCLAALALAPLAVALNAATTGDHLGRTLARGDWAVAGVDAGLLLTALAAAVAAWRLGRPATAADRRAAAARAVA